MPRTNFLVFTPDQMRADAIGASGNPIAHTPHMDALAARGSHFPQAYVQHPACPPASRRSCPADTRTPRDAAR
ncbi:MULTISPECIES: sulfatase-like hydrolase/transferase [unclassified Streptomyces]|uniref:sulfatase-like hydrolase/transferase n=1 Tax=unclassified Streptomyces TaxID=2593676 RepID=UPI00352F22AC